MEFVIEQDNLSDGQVITLLQSHLAEMYKHSPAESVHALQPAQLKQPNIHFFSARFQENVVACGALKILTSNTAEIKSMKTAVGYTRLGLAKNVLTQLIAFSRTLGIETLYLETGTADAFGAARALYQSFGFRQTGPFADYETDPHSCFYCLDLKSLALSD